MLCCRFLEDLAHESLDVCAFRDATLEQLLVQCVKLVHCQLVEDGLHGTCDRNIAVLLACLLLARPGVLGGLQLGGLLSPRSLRAAAAALRASSRLLSPCLCPPIIGILSNRCCRLRGRRRRRILLVYPEWQGDRLRAGRAHDIRSIADRHQGSDAVPDHVRSTSWLRRRRGRNIQFCRRLHLRLRRNAIGRLISDPLLLDLRKLLDLGFGDLGGNNIGNCGPTAELHKCTRIDFRRRGRKNCRLLGIIPWCRRLPHLLRVLHLLHVICPLCLRRLLRRLVCRSCGGSGCC
mmetsp:Transcript_86038/g.248419  ORF Transcript_86038/g.248419 Transcript_86038/m.248419 type:complete len:291 (+) Transcript_86038:1949-2821(+)